MGVARTSVMDFYFFFLFDKKSSNQIKNNKTKKNTIRSIDLNQLGRNKSIVQIALGSTHICRPDGRLDNNNKKLSTLLLVRQQQSIDDSIGEKEENKKK